jgi:plasmid stabilization system protein ParE
VRSELSRRARNDLERASKWWLREVGSPPLEELRSTLRMLERMPGAGAAYASSHGRTIHRILLRSSQFHVYYRLEPGVVRVISIWGTHRERGPRFPSG